MDSTQCPLPCSLSHEVPSPNKGTPQIPWLPNSEGLPCPGSSVSLVLVHLALSLEHSLLLSSAPGSCDTISVYSVTYLLIYYCVCFVCARAHMHICMCHSPRMAVRKQPSGVGSLLPPLCELQESNSGQQACRASSVSAEPSH